MLGPMDTLERQSAPNGRVETVVPPPRRRNRRLLVWAAAAALVVAAAAVLLVRARIGSPVTYFTQPAARGELVQTVTATGTVNPQNLILVGTQVSGTITEIDADYNSAVKAGQVLARLDPTSLKAALAQAQADEAQSERTAAAATAAAAAALATEQSAEHTVAADRAALASAQSQVGKAQAALRLADVTLTRDRTLLAQGYTAQNAVDADVSNQAAAQAALDAATIAVAQARDQYQSQTQVARSAASLARSSLQTAAADRAATQATRAQVTQALYNVNHSVIVSPVNGTVVARNVSIGQTVAASFQTPTLFSIGQDLTKMEIDIAVGEPDVGGVRPGDDVDFTVLAYPNRTFHGTVFQVRQNPTTVNNVVTYDTVIYERNVDGALMPGMTADASIAVARARNALLVPIAALQYAPPHSAVTAPAGSPVASSPWGLTEANVTRTVVAGRPGRIFVAHGGTLTPIAVRVALVAGTQAAVSPVSGRLQPGDPVVVGDSLSAAPVASAAARLPIGTTAGRGGYR